MAEVTIRKAVVADASAILRLVNELAIEQVMLPRSPASVVEHIRDFTVAEVDGAFVGCGALHIVWTDLAEVRSLAVAPNTQQKGLGKRIVDRLIDEAEHLGIAKLFAFTYVQGFFEKCDFEVVEHASLPHKVFSDCLNCPKFHCCDEIAMARVLREAPDGHDRGPLSRPLGSMPLPRTEL